MNPPVAFKSVAIELEFDDRLIETVGAKNLPPRLDWGTPCSLNDATR
jgi:hypothetical protein